jgi:hypothetical protein
MPKEWIIPFFNKFMHIFIWIYVDIEGYGAAYITMWDRIEGCHNYKMTFMA